MGSTIDFFSTLDVDDDVNELLGLHQQTAAAPSLRLPPAPSSSVTADAIVASLTARDLLFRQLAAQVMHGQAARLPPANVLVDGLMDDDWGSGDLFEVGSPDNPVPASAHAAGAPAGAPTPTMADLAAAYWHGRATGAMAAASPAVHAPSLPSFASGISPSATALTANLATANALATTEALNAQLLSQWLQSTDANSSAAAAASGALGGTWDPSLASLPNPSFGATSQPAAAAAPIVNIPTAHGLADISSPPFGAGSAYAALLGSAAAAAAPSAPASMMASTGPPSLSHLAARDLNTASSLLESRRELASALANRNSSSSSQAAAAMNNSASEYLSSMLELDEDVLGSALDGAESIGTIHSDDDSEDGMPTLEELTRPPARGQSTGSALTETRNNGGPGGNPSAAAAIASAVAASSTESANNDVHEGEDSKPPAAAAAASASAQPPRRSRRQAALRGLERISTALATHGMGGNDSDENDKSNGKIQATAPRKKPPTIIPKPSNKSLKKEESEGKEEPKPTCCICLEEPTSEELANISGCSHPFCFTCIEKWADQENTCPLCKARFLKIEKVNKPKKRKGGAGSEDTRSSKRVRNRDQRSDLHSFVNPLEGIFASMESNGTWPTHIAQLLFSGLGASTLGGGLGGLGRSARPSAVSAAGRVRRPTPPIPNPPGTSVFASAAAYRQQQRQAAPPTFRYQPPSSRAAAPSAAAAGPSQISSLLNQVRARQNQRLGGAFGASSAAASSNPFAMNPPPPPVARPPASRALPFPLETSPWATSTPVSVTHGAQRFAAQPPAASATSFQALSNPLDNTPTSAVAASSPLVDVEEEVDLLSTMSPSSYIRRLHREFDGSSSATTRQDRPAVQYQFNSSTQPARRVAQRTPGVMHPTPNDDPFSMISSTAPAPSQFNAGRSNRSHSRHARAAGRTVETALEIAESDDDSDIMEVIDVEALI